jgi:hypothetical protein
MSRRGLVLAATLLTGCGSAAAVVARHSHALTASGYATSPTSAGQINPRAVPLGDGYVSASPRVGYVDSCITHFGGQGGAQVNGPWIDTANRTWNMIDKTAVEGAVRWPSASYRVTTQNGRRVIRFNDLPIDHTTGVFPISSSDPAYQYDHNPNRIRAQSENWSLPLNPRAAAKPSCTSGGPIGVLRDGVVLFNALDGEGRDAVAHEVLDRCAGHPEMSGTYHHHDVPPCILDKTPNGRSTLVGYALDGYGIYVEKNARGVMPTDTALDACHGKTSRVRWNGRTVRIYHYVATLEYPYTVGCFHGTPITVAQGGSAGGSGPGAGAPGGPPSGPPSPP